MLNLQSTYTFVLICLLLLLSITYSSSGYGQSVIIVNTSIQEEALPLNIIRAIFSMRKTHWNDGAKIAVYVFKSTTENKKINTLFSTQILKLLPYQLKKAWNRNVYSGTGDSPHKVLTIQEMLLKVSTTPGAIGYIPKIRTDMPNVKILSIQNRVN